MDNKTCEQRRAIYVQVGEALKANGWVHQPAMGVLTGYTTYSRDREFLRLRFGHNVLRPTWAEYERPRLVGERGDLPDYWTGRAPYWYSRTLDRKNLLDGVLAVIASAPVTGPFQDDDDDED